MRACNGQIDVDARRNGVYVDTAQGRGLGTGTCERKQGRVESVGRCVRHQEPNFRLIVWHIRIDFCLLILEIPLSSGFPNQTIHNIIMNL